MIDRGTLNLGVNELCHETGLPARTFHRYFQKKEQVIGPFFERMTERFGQFLLASESSLHQSAGTAFRSIVLEESQERMLSLIGLLSHNRTFWSVFLEVVESSEQSFAEVLSIRFPGISTMQARVYAMSIVSSSRMSLLCALEGEDPVESFDAYLRTFVPAEVK